MNIDNGLRKVVSALATAQDYIYRAQAVPAWVSADGRVTPITEMTDQHLRNAIGVVERGVARGSKHTRALPAMRAELARRDAVRTHPFDFRPPSGGFSSRIPERTSKLEHRVQALEQTAATCRSLACQRFAQVEHTLDQALGAWAADVTKLAARVESLENPVLRPITERRFVTALRAVHDAPWMAHGVRRLVQELAIGLGHDEARKWGPRV